MKDKEQTLLTQCFIIARTHSSHLSSSHLFTSFPISMPICSAQLLDRCVAIYVYKESLALLSWRQRERKATSHYLHAGFLGSWPCSPKAAGTRHHENTTLWSSCLGWRRRTHLSFPMSFRFGTCPTGVTPCLAFLKVLLLNASHHHLELPQRQVLHLIDPQRSPAPPWMRFLLNANVFLFLISKFLEKG